jgi:DNA-binding XRE family transcriptional regulator
MRRRPGGGRAMSFRDYIQELRREPATRVELDAGSLGIVVANRIARARRDAGLSIDEFAKRLGVSPRTARAIEFGPYRGSIRRLVEIADTLGAEIDVIMRR